MKTNIVTLALLLLFVGPQLSAQQAQPPASDPPKIEQPKESPPSQIKSVVLIVCSDNLNKAVIVADNGEWLDDAREIEYTFAVGSPTKPKVKCVMFRGVFRPTKPEIKSWEVSNIILANNEEFQKVLDGLHDGTHKTQQR